MTAALKKIEYCSNCDTEITPAATSCNVCEESVGFPNVRLAIKETDALESRYKSSAASIKSRGIESVVKDFEKTIDSAEVVMVRSMNHFLGVIGNDNMLINTYHQQVASSSRLAESNKHDPRRVQIESTCHPFYYADIHYAALSLNGFGVSKYGEAHITFKENLIKNRTSFFQENPYSLVEKLNMKTYEMLPGGYRSTWKNKHKLAVCKLHSKIDASKVDVKDFQKILLDDSKEESKEDFIEAIIYGKIHYRSFESVSFIELDKPSKALLKANRPKIQKSGITVNIVE